MTTDKPALSTRLNQFWARMLAPINAYLGTALIAVILALPCYLIIHNRNQTELKKMKWELKYKSKKE